MIPSTALSFIGGIGPTELVVVLMLVVLLFGASKLPELGRSSGQALGEFKRGREQVEREIREGAERAREAETVER